MRAGLAAGLLGVLAAVVVAAAPGGGLETGRVARVVDGDTLALADGRRVRLVQIDTPEVGTGECYSRAAARVLGRLAGPGRTVTLEADRGLDRVDRYGRLLRYVWAGGANVNLGLVRDGAATVWFYHGERGRYAALLLRAAQSARAGKRGLWGACPKAVWDPYSPATTGRSGPPAARPLAGSCDPSYPTVCIPPPPPDLDCADVPNRRFKVLPPDPHRFDGDHDGIGCER
jgi:micrococcal nuclease